MCLHSEVIATSNKLQYKTNMDKIWTLIDYIVTGTYFKVKFYLVRSVGQMNVLVVTWISMIVHSNNYQIIIRN